MECLTSNCLIYELNTNSKMEKQLLVNFFKPDYLVRKADAYWKKDLGKTLIEIVKEELETDFNNSLTPEYIGWTPHELFNYFVCVANENIWWDRKKKPTKYTKKQIIWATNQDPVYLRKLKNYFYKKYSINITFTEK